MCLSVITVVGRVSAVLREGMGSISLFVRSVIGLFLESFVHLWMSVDAYMITIYDL